MTFIVTSHLILLTISKKTNLGKENEQIESKESTSELSDALIDITAIFNKHNHGTFYFGVKNNGDVCGMQVGESTIRDISRKVFEKIKPLHSFH